MTLTSYALTTYETVRDELGLSGAEHQTRIERLINSVSRQMATVASREFHRQAGLVERYGVSNQMRLFTHQAPIVSITSITEVDSDGVVANTINASTYEVEDARAGSLYRVGGWGDTAPYVGAVSDARLYGQERRSIEITYTCGWITPFQASTAGGAVGTRDLPEEIEEACIWSVVSLYSRGGRDLNITSRTNQEQSISFREGRSFLLAETHAVARSYKRNGWVI